MSPFVTPGLRLDVPWMIENKNCFSMKLLWILSVGLLTLISALNNAQAQTCGPRLRKDWDMLTATEKTTYKNALRAAMDSGDYIKFIEMHSEMRSEMEAHRQCMFIYWHRLFLVVFENMLRGQGAAYACVTVPYFNWIVANARVTSGTCKSLGDCMAITKELGGWTTGVERTLDINGISSTGRCVTESPLDRFCQLTSTRGSACAGCIPRSDWSKARVPATTSYASVRSQVFTGTNIGEMSSLVEKGCHNNVHSNLASTMAKFTSPSDPIFWSHHSMVDALHTIFHKCRVGTQRLTFAQKASHPVAWTSCDRRDGGTFRPTDVITMRTGEKGVNPNPGARDSKIGRYFTGVPNQFAGLMDVRDLGSSSYGYALTGQLAAMYNQCDKSPKSRKLEETYAKNASKPSMCGVPEGDSYDVDGNDYASQNNFPETDYSGQDDGHQDAVIVDNSGTLIDADTPKEVYITDDSEKQVVDWYDETIDAMGGDSHENMLDLERQACMFEHVCLGGTQDYSPEFKAIWKVKEPRCKTIVDAIIDGSDSIKYAPWREIMEAQFGCPEPPNSTNTTSYSGSWSSSYSEEDSTDYSTDTISFSDVLAEVKTTISTVDN
ncbi:hypothetical protein PHMEG_0002819 [Phytophthora megakarya]|uniref:Tyrosinase copper-binding domain-containing protein n=1 Tax=Phytophthora megakarya TaxID=4795 RepID=A0A225WXL0_9STRA|nr:hypothetical protein PHMEG_0002819 [Phytophthora megakarya]